MNTSFEPRAASGHCASVTGGWKTWCTPCSTTGSGSSISSTTALARSSRSPWTRRSSASQSCSRCQSSGASGVRHSARIASPCASGSGRAACAGSNRIQRLTREAMSGEPRGSTSSADARPATTGVIVAMPLSARSRGSSRASASASRSVLVTSSRSASATCLRASGCSSS
jgi:hypothetical protein